MVFTSAEGSFQVTLRKSSTVKTGFQVMLRFSISQQARDEKLLISFMEFIGCGKVRKILNKKYNKYFYEYLVYNFEDINTIIVPFFIK